MSASHATHVSDEPKSPLWLPALGLALFVVAAAWWTAGPFDPPEPIKGPPAAASGAPALRR